MSTTRCATVITRVLVRSRFAPGILTLLNLLLDTSHVVTALLVALAEVAVALASQPGSGGLGYRDTKAASSACTSYTSTPLPNCLEIGSACDDTQIFSSASRSK